MIRSSFRLASGVGPWLEARLWEAGIRRWEDFPAAPAVAISRAVDERIRAAIESAQAALEARDAEALATMLPRAERWRLYAAFAGDAAFLDVETCPRGEAANRIRGPLGGETCPRGEAANRTRGPLGGETDGDDLTCIGVLDAEGPRLFLRGRDLDAFPEAARRWKLLVTFNGLAFDVPALRRAFPGWRPPRAHVDLCHLWRRLGHAGGLKLLEQETGVGRPPHLAGLGGRDAVRLWRAWEEGDAAALRLLAEYNLHDAVNLRPLMDQGYNRIVERLGLPAAPVPVAERGDFRYDLSKLLLRL